MFQFNRWLVIGVLCHVLNQVSMAPERYSGHSQRVNEYLPPYSNENFGSKIDPHQSPRLQTHHKRPLNHHHHHQFRHFNSYAPPPSGEVTQQYSQQQIVNNNGGLAPSLLPEVLNEPVQGSQNFNTFPPQSTQQDASGVFDTRTPLVVMEEAPSFILTPTENKTLETARQLASSLLEANGEPPLENINSIPVVNPLDAFQDPNSLNNTDVVLVKTQKNAYIIPQHLAKDVRNPTVTNALYEMRDQFEKAYTINQFIFIIKPDKINFLNKLV